MIKRGRLGQAVDDFAVVLWSARWKPPGSRPEARVVRLALLHSEEGIGGAHGFQRADGKLGTGTADGEVGGAQGEDLDWVAEIGCQCRGGSTPGWGVLDGDARIVVLVGATLAIGGDAVVGFGAVETPEPDCGKAGEGEDGKADAVLSTTTSSLATGPVLFGVGHLVPHHLSTLDGAARFMITRSTGPTA
jgi:hypothetical protein